MDAGAANSFESTHADQSSESKPAPPKPAMKRRWLFAVLALAFLFVLMPFLFWEATWFGRPLDDAQMAKSLADTEHPREIQHALSQVADRILSPDAARRDSAKQFYPQVIRIAQTSGDELRTTTAWLMGQDAASPEFEHELVALLGDANPMVRRNAALALVRFHDTAGLNEIRAMLQPYSVQAAYPGKLLERLKPPEAINPGALLGWVQTDKAKQEMRSQVPGTIDHWLAVDGATVAAGQPVLSVTPSESEVWEALRALYLVGQQQDLPLIEQFENGADDVPLEVRRQASTTAEAIRSRH
jgi:biotin carboxyl carrier protein